MINQSYKPNVLLEIIGLIAFILGVATGNIWFAAILLIIGIAGQLL